MRSSYTCADARCAKCDAKLTGATSPGQAEPTPDDLSVCAYCGALLVFNHDLTLREATRADIATLPLDVAFRLGQMVALVHLRLREEQGNATH